VSTPAESTTPTPGSEATVAVVIPCFNYAQFLGDAIASVLDQTRAADEVIVVDDGSTDDTAAVAQRAPGVRYVWQRNAGPSVARNAGLAAVRSEFVQFLDADDVLLPTALESGLRCALAHPECAFVAGRHVVVRAEGSVARPWPEFVTQDLYAELLRLNFIGCPATVLYRRRPLLEADGFDGDPRVRGSEDYDLYLRLARRHRVALHDEVVAEYQVRGDSLSSDPRRMYAAVMTVLARQRAHVRGDAAREAALSAGWRLYNRYYGWPMLDAALGRLRRGEAVAGALRDFAAVAGRDRGSLKWFLRDRLGLA
jgi:glycosyltransferase involved in cell wall biosynthesis